MSSVRTDSLANICVLAGLRDGPNKGGVTSERLLNTPGGRLLVHRSDESGDSRQEYGGGYDGWLGVGETGWEQSLSNDGFLSFYL